MIRAATTRLADLYEADETAWLETMAELIQQRRFDELDYSHLGEYLADMARRDRREVQNRLAILLTHVLKWSFQPDKRSGSWRSTVSEQRDQLEDLLESGVLRNHAEEALVLAYARAVRYASDETSLPVETFPAACPYTLDQILSTDVLKD